MLTKAYVEDIIDNYNIKIRMPIYDKIEGSMQATNNEDLTVAIICTLPNCANTINVGDVVIVGFEDDDISKPIILGQLYRENVNTKTDLSINSLTTSSITTLSSDTSIGNTTSTDIQNLQNTKANIQRQIDLLNENLTNLQNQINEIKEKINE